MICLTGSKEGRWKGWLDDCLLQRAVSMPKFGPQHQHWRWIANPSLYNSGFAMRVLGIEAAYLPRKRGEWQWVKLDSTVSRRLPFSELERGGHPKMSVCDELFMSLHCSVCDWLCMLTMDPCLVCVFYRHISVISLQCCRMQCKEVLSWILVTASWSMFLCQGIK